MWLSTWTSQFNIPKKISEWLLTVSNYNSQCESNVLRSAEFNRIIVPLWSIQTILCEFWFSIPQSLPICTIYKQRLRLIYTLVVRPGFNTTRQSHSYYCKFTNKCHSLWAVNYIHLRSSATIDWTVQRYTSPINFIDFKKRRPPAVETHKHPIKRIFNFLSSANWNVFP